MFLTLTVLALNPGRSWLLDGQTFLRTPSKLIVRSHIVLSVKATPVTLKATPVNLKLIALESLKLCKIDKVAGEIQVYW